MTPPYYTVTVASLTRGWSYSTTHGDTPSTAADVWLADGLTYSWGFADDLIPGQLDPATASLAIYARSAALAPVVMNGDLITITVRLGATGAYVLTPPPLTAAEPILELLENDHPHAKVKLTFRLADPLADLNTIYPPDWLALQVGHLTSGADWLNIPMRWRARMASWVTRIGRTFGAPTWWSDTEHPAQMTPARSWVTGLDGRYSWTMNATQLIRGLVNSHQPGTFHHVIVAGYSANPATFPAGWGKVGPTTTWTSLQVAGPGGNVPITEPQTSVRYYVMPGSRRTDGAAGGLPLVFAVVSGTLTLRAALANPGANMRTALDAGWCDIAARARQAREYVIDKVRLTGQEEFHEATGAAFLYRDAERLRQQLGGSVAREWPTELNFGTSADSTALDASYPGYSAPAVENVAALALSDGSQRATWTWDDVTVAASRVPAADATALLPRLAPRAPGETDGDSQVVRHLTVYRQDPASRFGIDQPGPLSGFITSGQLRIQDGELTFNLRLTPGQPVWQTANPAPITVAQVDAASYQAQLCNTIDPLIRVADLAHVGA